MPRSWARRTIRVDGRRACIALEPAFWDGLKEIAAGRGVRVSALVTRIKTERQHVNLTSAVRLFVLGHYQSQLEKRAPQL